MSLPEKLEVIENGVVELKPKFMVRIVKPKDKEGNEWDQTGDAANNMRYAASLNIPHLQFNPGVKNGKIILVGGGPSIENELDNIRKLVAEPGNMIFALNWAHTWLIQRGIVPDACVMFEIDVDPCQILENAHPDVTYYICSHCHNITFDALKQNKRVLWHSNPNSEIEKKVFDEFFNGEMWVGGGISTFLRSISIALALGYRDFALFGVDSSFPDDAKSTHVGGYPTITSPDIDAFYIYAYDEKSGAQRRFKTVSYLGLQVEEFKKYCEINHQLFKMRIYGDTLLAFVHRKMWANQYE